MDAMGPRLPCLTERRCDGAYVVTTIDTLTPEKRAEIRRAAAAMGFPLPAPARAPVAPTTFVCGECGRRECPRALVPSVMCDAPYQRAGLDTRAVCAPRAVAYVAPLSTAP